MTVKQTIRRFFENGGRASQFELARMYNVSPVTVRVAIFNLRKDLPIAKVLYSDRKNESYYQLVPEMVTPRKGRPSHKFAVGRPTYTIGRGLTAEIK